MPGQCCPKSRGSSSSRLEGKVKLLPVFQLFWNDRFANGQRDLHEMYLLVRCSDLLQQGRISEVADALAGRIMALAAAGVPQSFWKWKRWTPATWRDRKRSLLHKSMPALWQNPNRVGHPGLEKAKDSKIPKAGQPLRRGKEKEKARRGRVGGRLRTRRRRRRKGEARLQGQEVRASPCQAAAAPLSVGCGSMPGSPPGGLGGIHVAADEGAGQAGLGSLGR